MNYIEIKVFEVNKGHSESYAKRFTNSERVQQLDGYLGAKVGLDTRKKDRDIVYVIMTWENQEKFDHFQNHEHKEMHKKSAKTKEKDENLLSYRSLRFEMQ